MCIASSTCSILIYKGLCSRIGATLMMSTMMIQEELLTIGCYAHTKNEKIY